MAIQWFPGHMTKAKREMEEKIKSVDMVIEIRDARIPQASENPMIQQIRGNKPCLIVLSKKDKADPVITKQWIEKLTDDNQMAISADLTKEDLAKLLVPKCQQLMKEKIERQIRKGIKPMAIKAMVAGIPNVGKSTLINRLAKRKVAETADRPGVTRSLKWVKVSNELELLDTPGVLWPRFDDQSIGKVLAITGAINDNILPMEDLAYTAMEYLMKEYPELIRQRYHISLQDDVWENVLAIGRSRGFLRAGNTVDEDRTVQALIREIRQDKVGRISWEKP
ncbi:MAG: ribosome biogenesis GTPase YlqF [Erysipelotrichaceae bacterium]|nr:ribosome biogenesis GTPase YlqF [Erysipelotrichaceae bacterium]